jgi:hypothetical protein
MALKATIQTTDYQCGLYPVFYALDNGVKVGSIGELVLVSARDEADKPTEFRIYAPGTWKEVNVEYVNE